MASLRFPSESTRQTTDTGGFYDDKTKPNEPEPKRRRLEQEIAMMFIVDLVVRRMYGGWNEGGKRRKRRKTEEEREASRRGRGEEEEEGKKGGRSSRPAREAKKSPAGVEDVLRDCWKGPGLTVQPTAPQNTRTHLAQGHAFVSQPIGGGGQITPYFRRCLLCLLVELGSEGAGIVKGRLLYGVGGTQYTTLMIRVSGTTKSDRSEAGNFSGEFKITKEEKQNVTVARGQTIYDGLHRITSGFTPPRWEGGSERSLVGWWMTRRSREEGRGKREEGKGDDDDAADDDGLVLLVVTSLVHTTPPVVSEAVQTTVEFAREKKGKKAIVGII
ncbi:predicted protein [Histoplasma mississippiense (nom. inval.)]|uniref:predicted protein n=1 Tax=Ajellomyces capsulatus (strain NAm1 / WU24) TaxID=2059318 RepID=UPI000157CD81|nr:predicted protein [Histoplasma mississippiense (nom. inval.)]EDN10152.1 predicted protein [Histoplasma mississippiense (nom. inval.)]